MLTSLYRASIQAGPQPLRTVSQVCTKAVRTTQQARATVSTSARLFDVDVNLTHKHLCSDIVQLLSVASTKANLKACIIPGSNLEDSFAALELAKNEALHEATGVKIYSTFGVHPYHARGMSIPESFTRECRRIFAADSQVVVALGECGLDQSEGFPPIEEQLVWFRHQLDLACELQMPLFLHERNAHDAFMKELYVRKDRLPKLLVHCFTGTEHELRAYLDFRCFISVSGLICRADKEGKRFKDVIAAVAPPPDRLLIETDAPYMQFPGCRKLAKDNTWKSYPNVPAAIVQVADTVARILGRDQLDFYEDSFRAAENFFSVKL